MEAAFPHVETLAGLLELIFQQSDVLAVASEQVLRVVVLRISRVSVNCFPKQLTLTLRFMDCCSIRRYVFGRPGIAVINHVVREPVDLFVTIVVYIGVTNINDAQIFQLG